MGWIDRLKTRSSKDLAKSADQPAACPAFESNNTAAPEESDDLSIVPPQSSTAELCYDEDGSQQFTFERPGAPKMVRATDKQQTAASFSAPVQQQAQPHQQQLHAAALQPVLPLLSQQQQQQQQQQGAAGPSNTSNGLGMSLNPAATAAQSLLPEAEAAQQQQQQLLAGQPLPRRFSSTAEGSAAGIQQQLESRSSMSSSSGLRQHRQPARHASFDAGYVQHRAMTAVSYLSRYAYTSSSAAATAADAAAAVAAADVARLNSTGSTAAGALLPDVSFHRSTSNISTSSSNAMAAGSSGSEDVEIGWVW
jgi:hypothetical protein